VLLRLLGPLPRLHLPAFADMGGHVYIATPHIPSSIATIVVIVNGIDIGIVTPRIPSSIAIIALIVIDVGIVRGGATLTATVSSRTWRGPLLIRLLWLLLLRLLLLYLLRRRRAFRRLILPRSGHSSRLSPCAIIRVYPGLRMS